MGKYSAEPGGSWSGEKSAAHAKMGYVKKIVNRVKIAKVQTRKINFSFSFLPDFSPLALHDNVSCLSRILTIKICGEKKEETREQLQGF